MQNYLINYLGRRIHVFPLKVLDQLFPQFLKGARVLRVFANILLQIACVNAAENIEYLLPLKAKINNEMFRFLRAK